MRHWMRWVSGLAVGIVGGWVGCAHPERASTVGAETRPVSGTARDLMSHEVLPNYQRLLDGLEGERARAASEWIDLEASAQRLAEHCSSWLMNSTPVLNPAAGESGLDPTWELASLGFRQSTAALAMALRDKHLERARASFESLNDTCSSCHRECEAAYILPWR